MTDYRLGGGKGGQDVEFRAHARHWLAIAKAVEQEHPGALTEQWKQLWEALAVLNAEVYASRRRREARAGEPARRAVRQRRRGRLRRPPRPTQASRGGAEGQHWHRPD
jgi:hypothetical protein